MNNTINLTTHRMISATHCTNEQCSVCDKPIIFTINITRKNYRYKIVKYKKPTKYQCGYEHFNVAKIRGEQTD